MYPSSKSLTQAILRMLPMSLETCSEGSNIDLLIEVVGNKLGWELVTAMQRKQAVRVGEEERALQALLVCVV